MLSVSDNNPEKTFRNPSKFRYIFVENITRKLNGEKEKEKETRQFQSVLLK